MEYERFTENARQACDLAGSEAMAMRSSEIGTCHLLLGVLQVEAALTQPSSLSALLEEHRLEVKAVRELTLALVSNHPKPNSRALPFTENAREVLRNAGQQAEERGEAQVDTFHLLSALLAGSRYQARSVLTQMDVNFLSVSCELRDRFEPASQEASPQRRTGRKGGNRGSSAPRKQRSALETYSRNLSEMARQSQLDPLLSRQTELRKLMETLTRRTKNTPVLVGEPGVGKTAIVEGLALAIAQQKVPVPLRELEVRALDMAGMLAGTRYRGEFEDRLTKVLTEAQENKNLVLFVDEIHTLLGTGAAEGSMDAASMLKPAMARGEVRLIGATTRSEYRKYLERDAAFARRLQVVQVDPPSREQSVEILEGLRERYQTHHRLSISDEAIRAAVDLSERYMPERFLPDKAIDLMDEAAAHLAFDLMDEPGAQPAVLGAEVIARVVAERTGIPVQALSSDEAQRYRQLDHRLQQRVIGQPQAVSAVARALRRSRAGIADPERPVGSFIFLGPTGVGKTELARALAHELFGDSKAMIRFDMSEYMEKHAASRLVGSSPGYVGYQEGGQLTEAVHQKPYCVLLLDEIEKAHPDVSNLLLQVLEDGHLTDGKGRRVDFKHTVIILTSNLGGEWLLKRNGGFGFRDQHDLAAGIQDSEQRVRDELRSFFRPELLNRLDETVVFRPLEQPELRKVLNLMLDRFRDRLPEQVSLRLSEAAVKHLLREGTDEANGARPLRRALQRLIEDPLADLLLDQPYPRPPLALEAVMAAGQIKLRVR